MEHAQYNGVENIHITRMKGTQNGQKLCIIVLHEELPLSNRITIKIKRTKTLNNCITMYLRLY